MGRTRGLLIEQNLDQTSTFYMVVGERFKYIRCVFAARLMFE